MSEYLLPMGKYSRWAHEFLDSYIRTERAIRAAVEPDFIVGSVQGTITTGPDAEIVISQYVIDMRDFWLEGDLLYD